MAERLMAERASTPPVVHNRTFQVYMAIAAIALLPGLLGAFRIELGSVLGDVQRQLAAALIDIKFGSGLRFWLGVAGAALMALLLLYPIRKAFAGARWLGSIGAWFHIHMVFGLLGPVLVAYHSNFGWGALNSNVALVAMLVVASSGIVGHFVYSRVSAGFYGDRQRVRTHLDHLVTMLRGFAAAEPASAGLIDRLEAFEARMLAPRPGIAASLRARVSIFAHQRQVRHDLAQIMQRHAQAQRWSREQLVGQFRLVDAHLAHYLVSVRAASNQAMREELWAYWRLFHLPVFLIMMVAVILHVAAVWDLDPPAVPAPANDAAVRTTAAAQSPAPVSSGPLAQVKRKTIEIAPAQQNTDNRATAVPIPQPAKRPAPAPQSQAAVKSQETTSEQRNAQAILPPQAPLAAPKPAPPADNGALYDALSRKVEADGKMALGAGRGHSLAQRIAELKVQNFDHNKTRFALTGKHVKVECASCHTKTLENTARECVACHEKDDVHRGRRPDCAQCHTTNRWSQILRRK